MKKNNKNNLITYGVFVIIAVLGIFYGHSIQSEDKFIRVWNYSNVLLLCIGIPFIFFQTKAMLPNFWQEVVSNRERIFLPIIIGILFGLFDIFIFKIILHPEPYLKLPPFTQPFPYSLFLYISGAFEVEVFYRLIPLTIILLFATQFNKGRNYLNIFWIGAVLTALREPLEQLPDGGIILLIYSFLSGFLMNFLQAVFYRKAGFIASLSIRLGHYLVWHILLGMYIQFLEIG